MRMKVAVLAVAVFIVGTMPCVVAENATTLLLSTDALLAELSGPLCAEVALHRCSSFLLNKKFLDILGGSGREDDASQAKFIKALVSSLRLVVFSPGDFAAEEGEKGEQMFFLSVGQVAVVVARQWPQQ